YCMATDGLRVGHSHYHVGDLAETERYYHATVGLNPTRRRNGSSFLSSCRYHHLLGMNVWQSQGAGQRDDATTGLAWFSLVTEKQELLAAQEERLRRAARNSRRSRMAWRPAIPGARGRGCSGVDRRLEANAHSRSEARVTAREECPRRHQRAVSRVPWD